MRRLLTRLTFAFAILFACPALADAPTAPSLSPAQIESLVAQLAQASDDPTTDCAACIEDCGVRYGRICNLACHHPFSVCSAMCNERRLECTQECRADLPNCRRWIRSCELEPGALGLR